LDKQLKVANAEGERDQLRAEVARLRGAIEEYRDLIKLLATTKA